MKNRGLRRTLIGMVVSDKLDKTVVVRVERLVKDPQYKKYVRRYSKFMAHDEANSCSPSASAGRCRRLSMVPPGFDGKR